MSAPLSFVMIKLPLTENNSPERINALALSPTGQLYPYFEADLLDEMSPSLVVQIQSFFEQDVAIGLLRLALSQFDEALPMGLVFWRQLGQVFITELCKHTSVDSPCVFPVLPVDVLNHWIGQVPFVRGSEYLNFDVLQDLWESLWDALTQELTAFDGRLTPYLTRFHSAWTTIGRVCFHLAENKAHPSHPFAFLATYTTSLTKEATTQHLPLAKALESSSGKLQQASLLALLLPVHRAAEQNAFIKVLVDSGQIFKPLAWRSEDAHHFLRAIPQCEAAGVMIRVPNWWQKARVTVGVTVGAKSTNQLGLQALLDFDIHVMLPNGEKLSSSELECLLAGSENLVHLKGQWIEIDREKLNQVLSHWQSIERQAKKTGLTFAEGLRLLAGVASPTADLSAEVVTEWSTVMEGKWLKEALRQLRQPEQLTDGLAKLLAKHLYADLRPYQTKGVQWLWWLYQLQLGGCLADDMGLGKTIQVISLMLLIKYQQKSCLPHLLVIPTSLLGNWQAELARFAPTLLVWVAHGVIKMDQPSFSTIDLVITTYGTSTRLSWLSDTAWDMIILDEAQAIKNPSARQTRVLKGLNGRVRFVLTGTPIENHLADLWSLFDFVTPGLLGTSRAFSSYSKAKPASVNQDPTRFYGAVRRLVSPYILRRLKSDKSIINDLPAKTEIVSYCPLTKEQVGLYQHAVRELAQQLDSQIDGIKRRGLVLAYLLRFKQLCNHPSQWLGYGAYDPELSGKFLRLKELCEIIYAKQEKVLVFTQFREIIPALCSFLAEIFQHEGVYLHGQTTVKERVKRVESFQQPQGSPFFVLSLKAGGTGLNLTAASHVIHFDRWWNPAVENQATDRAFRIGQKKAVIVHKFICLGTIEEKIDALLTTKKALSDDMLSQGHEVTLTELSDVELINMVTLDIHRALGD